VQSENVGEIAPSAVAVSSLFDKKSGRAYYLALLNKFQKEDFDNIWLLLHAQLSCDKVLTKTAC
jgi:hypothetical protein